MNRGSGPAKPWTLLAVLYAVLMLAVAVVPTYYSLQYRFGYEMTEETIPALATNDLLNALAAPCGLVGIGTLFALIAVRLLAPKPTPAPETFAGASADVFVDQEALDDAVVYEIERDPR